MANIWVSALSSFTDPNLMKQVSGTISSKCNCQNDICPTTIDIIDLVYINV